MERRVRLICWKSEVAAELAELVRAARYEVDASPLRTSGFIRQFVTARPAAIVIDLDRLPSHGHAVAITLRQSRSVASIPLVFAGGAEEKVAKIRRELPDAVYTAWANVGRAIRAAIANPAAVPVKPLSHMERYGAGQLVKKLGIKAGMKVALVAAPEGFEDQLLELPEDVTLEPRMTRDTALTIWFVHSRQELDVVAETLGARLREGVSAWIVYPKQAGRYKVDFVQQDVRRTALEAGLVDYKICAVDADWTGLKFAIARTSGSRAQSRGGKPRKSQPRRA